MAQNLYGAPYWSPDTVGHYKKPDPQAKLTYFTNDLAWETFSNINNPVTHIIKTRIENIKAASILEQFIRDARKRAAEQLGCSVGELESKVGQLNIFLREKERWLSSWVEAILKKQADKAQQVLDHWKSEHHNRAPLDINFDFLIDKLSLLTQEYSSSNNSALSNIISAMAKDGSDSGLAGKVGEITTAFNFIITTDFDNFINKDLDKIGEELHKSLQGTQGYKPDFTYETSYGQTITISVKNYKALKNANLLKAFGPNEFTDITVQSTGTLANFLSNLSTKIDPELDFGKANLELFYEYWLNLFYFRYYSQTSDAASKQIEDFRNELNKLLTLYGPVYLMTGSLDLNKHGNSLQERLINALYSTNTAMFFYITGQGLITFADILQILKDELYKATNMTSLEMHTARTNMNVNEVDVLRGGTYKESKVPRPRNLDGEIVTQKRFKTYRGSGSKALSTSIKLKIQLSRFKGLLKL